MLAYYFYLSLYIGLHAGAQYAEAATVTSCGNFLDRLINKVFLIILRAIRLQYSSLKLRDTALIPSDQ